MLHVKKTSSCRILQKKVHWNLDTTLCSGSTSRYSDVSETNQTALYLTSDRDDSLYYRLCFWHQNSAFANISLKHMYLQQT